jgi:hypothetical protein
MSDMCLGMKRVLASMEEHTLELHGYRRLREVFVLMRQKYLSSAVPYIYYIW